LVIATTQCRTDPQQHVDIVRRQLVLLEIALQLPVLRQLRLHGVEGLANFIALREQTLETSAGFRPQLFEFSLGRIGLGIGFGRISLSIRRGLVPGLSLCRCLVLRGLVPGRSVRVI
jgi:hypothetical protein